MPPNRDRVQSKLHFCSQTGDQKGISYHRISLKEHRRTHVSECFFQTVNFGKLRNTPRSNCRARNKFDWKQEMKRLLRLEWCLISWTVCIMCDKTTCTLSSNSFVTYEIANTYLIGSISIFCVKFKTTPVRHIGLSLIRKLSWVITQNLQKTCLCTWCLSDEGWERVTQSVALPSHTLVSNSWKKLEVDRFRSCQISFDKFALKVERNSQS